MKLVRDHIPALHQSGDLEPKEIPRDWTFHRATGPEKGLLLRLKLVEELGEVLSAPTPIKRISELYDLRDVIDAFLEHEGSGVIHRDVHQAKLTRLGGFTWG